MLRVAHAHIETAVAGRRGHFAGTSPCSVYIPFISAGTSESTEVECHLLRERGSGLTETAGPAKATEPVGDKPGIRAQASGLPDGPEAAEGNFPTGRSQCVREVVGLPLLGRE